MRNRNWVNVHNQVQPNAFRRRPLKDEHGVSVDLTFEQAKARLTDYYGVIKIKKSDVILLGLGLSVDESGHANITGLPFDVPEAELQVIDLARKLAARSEKCVDR